jgi:hypothetical protein
MANAFTRLSIVKSKPTCKTFSISNTWAELPMSPRWGLGAPIFSQPGAGAPGYSISPLRGCNPCTSMLLDRSYKTNNATGQRISPSGTTYNSQGREPLVL